MKGNRFEFWKNRRICVTGAGGFVGSWLSSALAENGSFVLGTFKDDASKQPFYSSTSPNNSIRFLRTDMQDVSKLTDAFAENEIDTVFHLAANNDNRNLNGSMLALFDSNIRATYVLLEACRLRPIDRVIIATSKEALLSPNGRINFHPYAISKVCVEEIANSYARSFGMPLGLLLPDNLYGGGDLNFNRLIPNLVRTILQNKKITLNSTTNYSKGYLYIEDFLTGLLSFGENLPSLPQENFISYCPSKSRATPTEIASIISHIVQYSQKDTANPVEKTNQTQPNGNYSRIPETLPAWSPLVDLYDGLNLTVQWYKKNLNVLG